MSTERAEILRALADAVINMDDEAAPRLAAEALQAGIDAYDAIQEGLAVGMAVVSKKYEDQEYFVPEILLCSDAMYAALEVLRPHLAPERRAATGKIVIGVIEGDTHDIGKNVVKMMQEGAGLEVLDLGRDVPPARFVDEAERIGADLIALSTLMSTTMHGMGRVIEILEERGLRDKYRVIIGGGPVNAAFAQSIGADAFGKDAAEAVALARRLLA